MWEFIRNVGEISSMVEYKNQIRFSMLNSTGEVCKSISLGSSERRQNNLKHNTRQVEYLYEYIEI
jgi:hypothetical protein